MDSSTGSSSGKAYDVFLCHNSADKPQVRQVYEALKVCGLKPWLEQEDYGRATAGGPHRTI